jgi:trans-aconitate methyltransferase
MDLKEVHEQIEASSTSRRHPWELARLEVVYGLAEKHLHNTNGADARVLDIGCGDLFFSSTLAQRLNGGRIIAVDTALSQEALPGINNKYSSSNIQIFQNLDDASHSFQEAGVVFLLDVLEHIPDDANFLEGLRQYPFITDNTVLIITTPAFQSLFSSHDTFLDHYRRYSSSSLSSVLKKSGFRVLNKGYFFFSLLPIRFMQTMWEKLNPRPVQRGGTDAADWNGGVLSTRLFQNMLMLDYKLTSLLGRAGISIGGLSTYAICKRSVL